MGSHSIPGEGAQDQDKQAYFNQFSAEYGLTDDWNRIRVRRIDDEEWMTETMIFSADPNSGNIRILYPNLYGGVFTYDSGSKTNPLKWLYRERLREPKTDRSDGSADGKVMKYSQPKGSRMHPFFTRGLIEKYERKEEIQTLYFTEGEKKAFKGWMHGLDIVGLPSINGYVREKDDRRLHEDIEELIRVCQVRTVVLLTDADTLTVSWKEGKDLAQRPASFYEAVNRFRQGCDALIMQPDSSLKRAYFMHIKTEYAKTCKGLDDLLLAKPDKAADIVSDLAQHHTAKEFFYGYDLTDGNLSKLRYYFGLDKPEDFYKVYGDAVGYREFTWKGRCYQYTGDRVEYRRHQDADQYMRIGDTYMKVVKIPNKNGDLEPQLRKWKPGEIKRDYFKFPSFFDEIPKYEAFCNVPSNNGVYKRIISSCYNIYEPIAHEYIPWEGDYESIKITLSFMKHLFGGEATAENDIEGDPFTVMLDYLTILHRHPTQILPVPCLVSPENNTGKSTFLKWLKDIYGTNATILGNEQFKQSFNSHYITKFIIGIDEGFIDVEKKADKERLKKLATDEKQFVEYKGMDSQEIDYFGKIIICSNDADRLMRIDEGEIRWFVVRVPKLTAENPHMRQQMRAEIPAWLGFLWKREIRHKNESRAWFNPKYLITDQLRKIIEKTRNYHEKVIDTYIRDQFEMFGLAEFKMHKEYLLTEINKQSKYKIDGEALIEFLKTKKGLKPVKQTAKIPYEITEYGGINYLEPKQQRYYTFSVADWLSAQEIEELGITPEEAGQPLPFTPTAPVEPGKEGF